MEPGKKQTFVAKGTDQFGNDFNIDEVIWSATGGEIGVDGVFDAGDDEGNFIIQASTSGLTCNSEITISKEATPLPPKPPPPQGEKTLRWSGEIPTQKWMNFYTKVLTKLVTAGGLKVSVSIESKPEGGVSERQVEDVKTSLRGLGLNDSVDSS